MAEDKLSDDENEAVVDHFLKLFRLCQAGDFAEAVRVMADPPKGVRSGYGIGVMDVDGIHFHDLSGRTD